MLTIPPELEDGKYYLVQYRDELVTFIREVTDDDPQQRLAKIRTLLEAFESNNDDVFTLLEHINEALAQVKDTSSMQVPTTGTSDQ